MTRRKATTGRPTSELRRIVKARFFPYAIARGFAVDESDHPRSTTFRRVVGQSAQMFEVRWEKYGRPRFALYFGTCPAEGLRVNGELHPVESTLPTWCPDTGSLRPRRATPTGLWFRQDATLLQRLRGRPALRDPAEVVNELLAHFPELEHYWASGEVGAHLRLWHPR